GVLEVRASPCRPTSALMRLDLPTLERPAKAISTRSGPGRKSRLGTLRTNCHGRANSASPAASCSGVTVDGLMVLWEPGTEPSRAFLAAQDVARLGDPGGQRVIGAVEALLERHPDLEISGIQ